MLKKPPEVGKGKQEGVADCDVADCAADFEAAVGMKNGCNEPAKDATVTIEGNELKDDELEDRVFGGEYAEECVRLVATAWAADVGILNEEEDEVEEADENVEEGMQTPIAFLSYEGSDGEELQDGYKFKQVKTKGVIAMSTRVTLTLDQIYKAFEIIKTIEYGSEDEEGEVEDNSELEMGRKLHRKGKGEMLRTMI